MYLLANKALRWARQTTFRSPIELLETIWPAVFADACVLTGKANINANFIYNALVSVDNAAWVLYAAEHGMEWAIEPLDLTKRCRLYY
ncbi:hypothetical protein [Parapedobacter tibetensis]|uniref:hypothetical protein n=1 Tax=Parapedobacter tibetensis TaxID=2972951 RepID=UPI00214D2BAD|nr:hypothetical protein [Parapedobacter tibetensis]